MIQAAEVASFYENAPSVDNSLAVEGNSFLKLMVSAKESATQAYDKLAYLAGIKAAATEDRYRQLDTTSLDALLRTARQAGFETQILSV